jgi:hypothetical protein
MDRHQPVRADAEHAQVTGQPVGARVQLAIAEAAPIEDDRRRLRALAGLYLEQLVDAEIRWIRYPGPVPFFRLFRSLHAHPCMLRRQLLRLSSRPKKISRRGEAS